MGFVWIVVDVMNIFQQIKNKQQQRASLLLMTSMEKDAQKNNPFPLSIFQLQFSNNWFILPNPAKNIYPQLRAPWTNDYASDYRLFLSNACKGRMIPCPSRPPPTPPPPCQPSEQNRFRKYYYIDTIVEFNRSLSILLWLIYFVVDRTTLI